MSFRRLTTTVVFLAVFAMAVRVSVDSDTWWHLRAGAWIVENRQLLDHDPFSLTRSGQPWIYPGWMAQVLFYSVYAGLGYAGLNLLTAAAVVVALAFVWSALEGPVLLRAFVIVVAAMTSAVYWSARPQILSFALAGVFLWALEKSRAGSIRTLWLLPPVMALWVNLHGGFAIGFLLLAVYIAGEATALLLDAFVNRRSLGQAWLGRRTLLTRLLLCTLACVLAVSVNPNGPVMLLYPFKTVSIQVLQQYIQEWQSPDFHNLEPQAFLWMLFLTFAAMATSGRRPAPVELIGVIAFAYLAFLAGRNIAVFALVASPILARHAGSALAPLVARIGSGPKVPARLAGAMNVVILVLALLAAAAKVIIPLDPQTNEQALADRLPVEAVTAIARQGPPGPLFNSYNWGGYVLWALYPDYPSFVDGRTDLFDDAILEDYLLIWRALPGWEAELDRWDIHLVLVEPDAPLARALETAGWRQLHLDEQAIVMARPDPR
jgi:hypothetical protein